MNLTTFPIQRPSLARARLNMGALARFATGLTLDAILRERGCVSSTWWRHAVVDAEDRGLVVWSRKARMWRLTPAGRAVTRSIA